MDNYLKELLLIFFTSLGLVLGGAVLGSLATLWTGDLPLATMLLLAERLKIWGAVAALGGTFGFIQNLESGLLTGQLGLVARELIFIATAFVGANLGYFLILGLAGGR